jgi:hypothetical protein
METNGYDIAVCPLSDEMPIMLRLSHQILFSPKRPAFQGSECEFKIAVSWRNESDISQPFLGLFNFCVVFNQ